MKRIMNYERMSAEVGNKFTSYQYDLDDIMTFTFMFALTALLR